jgi:ankyrin repeat protein
MDFKEIETMTKFIVMLLVLNAISSTSYASACLGLKEAIVSDDKSKVEQILSEETYCANSRVDEYRWPIHVAVEEKKSEIVRILLQHGANPNQSEEQVNYPIPDTLPLMIAAKNDADIETIEALVDAGSNLNMNWEFTPLYIFASRGRLDAVSYLANHGADLHMRSFLAQGGAIHAAAYANHVEIVSFLINKGVSIDELGRYGMTPLIFAAWGDAVDVLKFLIENGADIKAKETPVNYDVFLEAIANNSLKSIEYLVHSGFDVNFVDGEQKFPLLIATREGALNSLQFLLKLGAYPYQESAGHTIISYVKHKTLEGAANILLPYIDLNHLNSRGESPLHEIAYNWINTTEESDQFFQVTEKMINSGAKVNVRSNNGSTFLHLLAGNCEPRSIKLAIEHGADLNLKNNNGDTPLHLLNGGFIGGLQGEKDISECANILLKNGAQTDVKNNQGQTPLLSAVGNQHLLSTKYLIPSSNKSEKDLLGNNAVLTLVAFTKQTLFSEFYSILTLLADAGFDLKAINNEGDNFFHLYALNLNAGEYPYQDYEIRILKYVVGQGVEINLKNKKGKTPTQLALELKKDKMAEIFKSLGGI